MYQYRLYSIKLYFIFYFIPQVQVTILVSLLEVLVLITWTMYVVMEMRQTYWSAHIMELGFITVHPERMLESDVMVGC